MYPGTLDAYACADGVDAVVVRLHGHLGSFARFAGHGTDSDQTVVDFRYFLLEQTAHEAFIGAAQDYFGVIIIIVYAFHYGAHYVALMEEIAGNLLLLRHQQVIVLIIDQEHLAFPDLMHLGRYEFTFLLLELIENRILLQVCDFSLQSLA